MNDSVRATNPMHTSELLVARGIRKRFPGVLALDGVDLTICAGEIHALMGENGAGKSTLIKALTGVHPRDAGTVHLAGVAINPRSPQQAEAVGLSTVYQEVNLIPRLTVAENICLGREPTFCGAIRWRAVRERARQALRQVGLDIDVDQELGRCSLAIQQMVAIARALDVSAKVLILDEPTSSLDQSEVVALFSVLRRLRDQGMGIVLVTHFLDQVYVVCDRITVLRDGKLVGNWDITLLPRRALVSAMLGRDWQPPELVPTPGGAVAGKAGGEASQAHAGAVFLETKALTRTGAISPFDLTIRRGEVVGLAGLLGSGRSEIARLLFGADQADGGSLCLQGVPVAITSPRTAIRHGMAFITENRKTEGIIPNLSVRENLILALQGRLGPWRPLSRTAQERLANEFITALGIKTPSAEQAIRNLSGGNQQKVLIARWLCMKPQLLLLDEPTRGIDVGAKAEIELVIARLRADGLAILFISSELDEVVRTCARVLVLRDHSPVGELAGASLSEHAILEAIAHEPHVASTEAPLHAR